MYIYKQLRTRIIFYKDSWEEMKLLEREGQLVIDAETVFLSRHFGWYWKTQLRCIQSSCLIKYNRESQSYSSALDSN